MNPRRQANDLLFGATTQSDATASASAGAGYTLRQSQPDDNCGEALFTEDGIGPAAGSYAAAFTYARAVHYRAAIVAFRGG